ncbi:hypothetical protein F4561_005415 [Lipingzhangella halophila]|uniref:Uncharacterized protein n=1 Tax=Lipingzhangella halophila TaxID=1783352 RepID=A0A7W7RM88_9ACTN|nr:hypothetical protein [Lipingzhangella halophila]
MEHLHAIHELRKAFNERGIRVVGAHGSLIAAGTEIRLEEQTWAFKMSTGETRYIAILPDTIEHTVDVVLSDADPSKIHR